MARNNAWANYRLLQACVMLTQTEFEAPRTGFFPSIRKTLNHILYVDWFYVDALEGGKLGAAAWADEEPCKTAIDLLEKQAAVDRRLIQHCSGLSDGQLQAMVSVHREGGIELMRRDRLLLHVFQHQIHHRGQAHAMLAGTRVPPPQLDEFYSESEAQLREADFKALGWREDEIWQ